MLLPLEVSRVSDCVSRSLTVPLSSDVDLPRVRYERPGDDDTRDVDDVLINILDFSLIQSTTIINLHQ